MLFLIMHISSLKKHRISIIAILINGLSEFWLLVLYAVYAIIKKKKKY